MKNLKIGDTHAGGLIFYLDPGSDQHGLVCAPYDQAERIESNDADIICKSLRLNGYSDWRLPSNDELSLMYTNLHTAGLGGFTSNYYWSSTAYNADMMWSRYFGFGFPENDGAYNPGCARAGRVF